MSKAEFTPGTWKVDVGGRHVGLFEDGLALIVATTNIGGASLDRQLANARLIAAAPELYEALQGLVEISTNTSGDWSRQWNAALSALAKARGEPS